MGKRVVVLAVTSALIMVGCVPEMPAIAYYPTLDPKTDQFKAGIVKDKVNECVGMLNTERSDAKTQRNVAAALAFLGGGTGVASGTISGVMDKDKDSTKNALAFVAAGGALVALTAPLIGNPSETLKEHAKRFKHWQRAQDALYNLNSHVENEPTKPGTAPTEPGAEPPATPTDAHDAWKAARAAYDAWKKVSDDHAAWEKKGRELVDIVWKEASACSGDPDAPAAVAGEPAPPL